MIFFRERHREEYEIDNRSPVPIEGAFQEYTRQFSTVPRRYEQFQEYKAFIYKKRENKDIFLFYLFFLIINYVKIDGCDLSELLPPKIEYLSKAQKVY